MCREHSARAEYYEDYVVARGTIGVQVLLSKIERHSSDESFLTISKCSLLSAKCNVVKTRAAIVGENPIKINVLIW